MRRDLFKLHDRSSPFCLDFLSECRITLRIQSDVALVVPSLDQDAPGANGLARAATIAFDKPWLSFSEVCMEENASLVVSG
jgi:hypothetical protein